MPSRERRSRGFRRESSMRSSARARRPRSESASGSAARAAAAATHPLPPHRPRPLVWAEAQPPLRQSETRMKLFLIGFLGAASALTAQVPGASNKVAPAILGFTLGAGPAEVHPILGVFGAARIGDPLAVPETVTRLYLSSRQHYALAENSAGALAVWGLDE